MGHRIEVGPRVNSWATSDIVYAKLPNGLLRLGDKSAGYIVFPLSVLNTIQSTPVFVPNFSSLEISSWLNRPRIKVRCRVYRSHNGFLATDGDDEDSFETEGRFYALKMLTIILVHPLLKLKDTRTVDVVLPIIRNGNEDNDCNYLKRLAIVRDVNSVFDLKIRQSTSSFDGIGMDSFHVMDFNYQYVGSLEEVIARNTLDVSNEGNQTQMEDYSSSQPGQSQDHDQLESPSRTSSSTLCKTSSPEEHTEDYLVICQYCGINCQDSCQPSRKKAKRMLGSSTPKSISQNECLNTTGKEETAVSSSPVRSVVENPVVKEVESEQTSDENIVLITTSWGMQLYAHDLQSLPTDEYLNDQIIDFQLKYIHHTKLSDVDRKRSYIFSTFFYSKLTDKNPADKMNVSVEERRHGRVAKWTKNEDLFGYDYILVPIVQDAHWILAVICFPGLDGIYDSDTGQYLMDLKATQTTAEANEASSQKGLSKRNPALEQKILPSQIDLEGHNIKRPCILVFDSLAKDPKHKIYATLRQYLQVEYKVKKGLDKEFSKQTMPGYMPKVPQQPNSCDCGVFLLQYAESFFSDPVQSQKVKFSNELKISFETAVTQGKRKQIYDELVALITAENPALVKYIPKLTFP